MHIKFLKAEGSRDRWQIWVDGELWKEVHTSIFGRHPKFPSLSSESNLETTFDTYEYQRVRNYVIWRLSSQAYHSEMLKKLLRNKCVQSHTIERVIQEFQEKGLLDDALWIQFFMQSQQKRYGMKVILAKLYAKGLTKESLEKISEEWQHSSEEENIRRILETKYRRKDLSDYKERQKAFVYLSRKGYSFETIQQVLNS